MANRPEVHCTHSRTKASAKNLHDARSASTVDKSQRGIPCESLGPGSPNALNRSNREGFAMFEQRHLARVPPVSHRIPTPSQQKIRGDDGSSPHLWPDPADPGRPDVVATLPNIRHSGKHRNTNLALTSSTAVAAPPRRTRSHSQLAPYRRAEAELASSPAAGSGVLTRGSLCRNRISIAVRASFTSMSRST